MLRNRTYVDNGIFQHSPSNSTLIYGVLPNAARDAIIVFQVPAPSLLVECQLGRVVTFVEILEYSRKHLRLLTGKVDTFARGFEKLRPTDVSKVRGLAQHIFVSCEESLRWSDADCDDG